METDIKNVQPYGKEKFNAGNDFSEIESSRKDTLRSIPAAKESFAEDSEVVDNHDQRDKNGVYHSSTQSKKDKQSNEVVTKQKPTPTRKSQFQKQEKLQNERETKDHRSPKSGNAKAKPHEVISRQTLYDINDDAVDAYNKYVERNKKKRNDSLSSRSSNRKRTCKLDAIYVVNSCIDSIVNS